MAGQGGLPQLEPRSPGLEVCFQMTQSRSFRGKQTPGVGLLCVTVFGIPANCYFDGQKARANNRLAGPAAFPSSPALIKELDPVRLLRLKNIFT